VLQTRLDTAATTSTNGRLKWSTGLLAMYVDRFFSTCLFRCRAVTFREQQQGLEHSCVGLGFSAIVSKWFFRRSSTRTRHITEIKTIPDVPELGFVNEPIFVSNVYVKVSNLLNILLL
jgi:hypothetical protein